MRRSSLFVLLLAAVSCVWGESVQGRLQQDAETKKLSQTLYWRRLLHYRRSLLGRYQSEITDRTFFISPKGRHDPEAELQATLAAFFEPPPKDETVQHAECRYPERYAWLKSQLHWEPTELPDYPCPRFEQWRAQMNPGSVSLIFAAAYMNNPSSMYGHTFLRLNKKGQTVPTPLLDYAVNFAADLEDDNGILFAMKGLIGSYPGRFSTMPYYIKVQEYNNLESRDLWEYQLNLSPEAIDRLLRHLWELGMSGQPYYFLNKNCSYYFLPFLEVVEPDLHVKDEFVLRTAPVDSIRTLMRQPGLMGPITRRLSLTSKLLESRNRLTPSEIGLVEKLSVIQSTTSVLSYAGLTLDQLPPDRQALVLDTAHNLFRYKVGFKRDREKEIQNRDHALLVLRSNVQAQSPRVETSTQTVIPPHIGHPTGRLQLSYGFSNRSHFEEISIRPAIHDPDDPPQGYLPGSRLEMFHLKLRYDNDRYTLYVQQFSLVDLLSITAADQWIHPPSWKVNTGVAVANDLGRDSEHSLYYGLNLGTGYAAHLPGVKDVLVYGMGEMELELGHAYSHSVRFGGGPSGGLLFAPGNIYRLRFLASYFPYAVGGTSATTKFALYQSLSITEKIDLRVKLERQNQYKEVLFSWVWFL